MTQILHKDNLENFITEVTKKISKYQALKKGYPHALVVLNSSVDA
jgi:hypothetical protein